MKNTTQHSHLFNVSIKLKALLLGLGITFFSLSAHAIQTPSTAHEAFIEGELDFRVYPNPTRGNTVTLVVSGAITGKVQVSLHNTIGTEVYQKEFDLSKSQGKITLSPAQENLANGLYFLAITEKDHRVMKKLIIN
jgi:hypothetical protein